MTLNHDKLLRRVDEIIAKNDGAGADPWAKAIAMLLRVEVDLRIEERDDRRRGTAGEVAAQLEKALNDGGYLVPRVTPGIDGKTLILTLSNRRLVLRSDLRQGGRDGVEWGGRMLNIWHDTGGARAAGWSIQFLLGLRPPGPCKHAYTTDMEAPAWSPGIDDTPVKSMKPPVESPCCVLCGFVPKERMFFHDEAIGR